MMKKVFSFALMLCLVCSSLGFTAAAADDGLEQFNALAQSILAMDPDVSLEQVDELLAQLEDIDLDGEEDQNALTGSMVGSEAMSTQMLFAQLQMQLAQFSKEQAAEQINAVKAAQERCAQVAVYVDRALLLFYSTRLGQVEPVPEDMLQFLQANSLYTPSDPSAPDGRDWQAIIQGLESLYGHLGDSIQQQMVSLQDYMEQYNQYSGQASSLLDSAMQDLSGSATMLGAGGAGLAVTALVAGLAAGSLITALVLRRKQNKA